MQKIIFHIHDKVCKHASNTLEDIVSYSLENGYEELYFTEHNPISVKCDYQKRRATHQEIEDLVNRINEVNKKYEGKLHIYFGYECEFNKPNRWYFERLARDPLPNFLISGNHFYGDLFKLPFPFVYTKSGTKHVSQFKELLDNFYAAMASGLYSWIPHPDIFLYSYRKWDKYSIAASKKLIKWAKQFNLPFGFNINWPENNIKDEWHYPCKYFWELVAKSDVKVIIESDSHDHHTITKEWLEQGRGLALSYGLEKNIVDKIDINWLDKRPHMILYEKKLFNLIPNDILNNWKENKVKFIEVNSKTSINKLFKDNNIHPVWTVALINNDKLLKLLRKTSTFIISNKQSDLGLDKFSKLDNKQFMDCFIKEP